MRSLTTAVRKKKGQAMIETIMMLPFIIAVLFFIYQSYILVNKVQVVQKYLKGGVLGALMNRNAITAESSQITGVTPPLVPMTGKYFMVYNDDSNMTTGPASGKKMKVNLDDITLNMLLYFCPGDEKGAVKANLQGMTSPQTLGVCIGGRDKMKDQVSPAVLGLQDGEICGSK
jgi:hypothetical protein